MTKIRLIILISILLFSTLSISLRLFFYRVKPVISALKKTEEMEKILITNKPIIVKKITHEGKNSIQKIIFTLKNEEKKHHCKIKKIATDFKESIKAEIIINYQSTLHLLTQLKNKKSTAICDDLSLKKINKQTLLLLTLSCQLND